MKRIDLIITILFTILLAFILIKIPKWVNDYRNNNYSIIKQNGFNTVGVVYSRSTYKGKWIKFKYFYKKNEFKNKTQNDELYNFLSIGDTINIMVDSLRPENSYAISLAD